MALQLFSTGDHDNPGFVEKVKQFVFPDLEPSNLEFPHARFIQNGLISAQTFVECLRSNNVNFYDKEDVTVSCKVATLTGPNRARIQAVYAFKPDRKCLRVPYEQRGVGAIACYGNSHGCCVASESAADIVFQSVMSGEAFCDQDDLVITESAFKCDERIWARGACDRIYLASMFPCDYKVAVHWEGIKQHYADTDLITDDEELLNLIALYLEGQRALRLDRDMDKYDKIMRKPAGRGDWGGTYWQELMDMKHRCREERRLRGNYLCDATFDDNALVDACAAETGNCTADQYLNAQGECVDCNTPSVSLTAEPFVSGEVQLPIGQPLELHYNSSVPDIDSSVVTLEFNGQVQTLTRNLNGVVVMTLETSTMFTIRAVTVCGTVTATLDVTLVENPPCLCPSGLPDCLQLTKEDPADFTACSFPTNGGDASLWDGTFPRLSECRWGVEFVAVEEIGIGGFFVNSVEGGAQIKAIIELISCNPYTYQMSLTIRDASNEEITFWRGICLNSPVGTYTSEQYGIGIHDFYCYENTNFTVEACFDEPCVKSTIRFDPPSGSTVNFPTLVFLHSTLNNDSIFYRINEGSYQAYTGPFSVEEGDEIDAYAVTAEGCLGDVFSATYTADQDLEFEFICDGPNDKAGVFGEFAPNGVSNDYHWKIRVTRAVTWTFNKAIIYETDEDGVWVTGQAWATVNPIFPIEISPTAFPVYPMVFFDTTPTQINTAYGDPVTTFVAGLTELHAYGQPFKALVGYFRLEFTLDIGAGPFTIYKLIPHFCDECPPVPSVILDSDCEGLITITSQLQIGSTYRLYRAELAPCGSGTFGIIDEFIATSASWEYEDSGTNDCSYSYLLSLYCPQTSSWIDGASSTVEVPPPCDVPESFCNTTPIFIPTFQQANPYPSPITVTGRPGTVVRAMVEIFGYRHQFPSDVEILLVGPDGTSVILMNDCGGGGANQILTPGVNILFSDAATSALPNFAKITAGTYQPTSYGTGYRAGTGDGTFFTSPAPAPAPTYNQALSAFIGKPCNGVWKLFVNDDHGQESGAIDGGWCLYLPLT